MNETDRHSITGNKNGSDGAATMRSPRSPKLFNGRRTCAPHSAECKEQQHAVMMFARHARTWADTRVCAHIS